MAFNRLSITFFNKSIYIYSIYIYSLKEKHEEAIFKIYRNKYPSSILKTYKQHESKTDIIRCFLLPDFKTLELYVTLKFLQPLTLLGEFLKLHTNFDLT